MEYYQIMKKNEVLTFVTTRMDLEIMLGEMNLTEQIPYDFIYMWNLFKIYILLIMLLQLSHFFLPFTPLHPVSAPPPTIIPPPQFMSMGHSYKFFGFSISHTILNLPRLFCAYHLCFLFPVPFPPFSPSPSSPITLHGISISVNLFLYMCCRSEHYMWNLKRKEGR